MQIPFQQKSYVRLDIHYSMQIAFLQAINSGGKIMHCKMVKMPTVLCENIC